MKIFHIGQLRIEPLYVIAHDLQHATHIAFEKVHAAVGYVPEMTILIREWQGSDEQRFDGLKELGLSTVAGIIHSPNDDDNWELIPSETEYTNLGD